MSFDFTFKPEKGSELEISATTTSATNATPFTRDEIALYCASNVYIKFGGSDVEAATDDYDKFCVAGTVNELNTGGNQYVAVILASGTDTVYINQWTKK